MSTSFEISSSSSSSSNTATNSSRPPLLPWSKETWQRWASIPRLHKAPIPRTKFVLLKAPVSTLYEEKYLDRNIFTVSMYASRMTSLGTSVGMVIDCTAFDLHSFAPLPSTALSKTSSSSSSTFSSCSMIRYFHDVTEWQQFDIDYIRLIPSSCTDPTTRTTETASSLHDTEPCIPTQENINQFSKYCTQFWEQNSDTYISVFDSRGGYGIASYFIGCYMCGHLKAPVHVALASIENTLSTMTGTGLLDVALVEDLQKRFHGTREIVFDSSKIPNWWRIDDKTAAISTTCNERSETIIRIPPIIVKKDTAIITTREKRESYENIPHANGLKRIRQEEEEEEEEEIPALQLITGNSPLYQRAKTVLDQLMLGCKLMEEYPVTPSNITQLYSLNQKYKITWISEGRRGLLLILAENIFFIEPAKLPSSESTYTISYIKGRCMNFPLPNSPVSILQEKKQQQHRTLLDVILVQDVEDSTNNKIQHRFMIRDILAHHGGIVTNKPFHQRLKYIMDGVIQPRKRDTTFDYNQEPIRLRAYEFFDVDRVEYVVSEVITKQYHQVKGILIIPADGFYKDNQDNKALSWMLDSDLSKNDLFHHIMGDSNDSE